MYGERVVIMHEGMSAEAYLNERYKGFKALAHGVDFSMPIIEAKA